MILLKWNNEIEEGVIKVHPTFNKVDPILQMDCLTDWIFELQKLHDEIFDATAQKTKGIDVLNALGLVRQRGNRNEA